jgi:hypothetical protein
MLRDYSFNITHPDGSRGCGMYQRANWTRCSKKGNISKIAQQQHNTLLIGELEWTEVHQLLRIQEKTRESMENWIQNVQESVDGWCEPVGVCDIHHRCVWNVLQIWWSTCLKPTALHISHSWPHQFPWFLLDAMELMYLYSLQLSN